MSQQAPGSRISRSRLTSRAGEALDSGSLILVAGAGFGKTTLIEQAVANWRAVAWVSCSGADRSPGRLAIRIVDAVAAAVPGASNAIAERLVSAFDLVDALAAMRELLAELAKLLVEPLVLVIDDAEHLIDAPESLRLIDELMRAEIPALRVVVASRRPLDLHVAKPRAAGRLSELGAADLAFDAVECAAVLRQSTGVDPPMQRAHDVMEATEGWPLGVVLAAGLMERAGQGDGAAGVLGDLSSAPDLHAYLSEELLSSLDPELREGALDSSVVRVVSDEVSRALHLRGGFRERVERAGMLMRAASDGFVYHPLLREFLLERLRAERSPEEWRQLNSTVAPAVAAGGDVIAAIEHWLEAESWRDVVDALEINGFALIRSSPELVTRWLSLLPQSEQRLPTMRALEGQLHWLHGDYERATPSLDDAVRGFADRPNVPAEWMARSILVDLFWVVGEPDRFEGLVEGWDGPAAADAFVLAPAAALFVATCLASYGRFETSERMAAAALEHPDAGLVAPVEALRLMFIDVPGGRIEEACARMRVAVDELARADPFQRRNHVHGALAAASADLGDLDAALATWMEIRENATGAVVAPALADATHAWCASLHAQQGRLAEAEAELAQHRRMETGSRAYIGDLAIAGVAALRGDAARTLEAANGALATVSRGATVLQYWCRADVVDPLGRVGRLERAHEVVADTLALIDENYPGDLGCFMRGRMLALRGWLRHLDGDSPGADADLRAFWDEAGEPRCHILRRHRHQLGPLVWGALERGALEAEETVAVTAAAFPDGRELVAFLDHPLPAVRKAALDPAVRSGDPGALARVETLKDDADADLAAAATKAAGRLSASLPPLRFELLGEFSVTRGSWRVGEGKWGRPIDARLVRFLLVNLGRAVPEDLIYEALWPELETASARRSLQVAASRARRVLDVPGAERSVIEAGERTYRLVLSERDTFDVDEFAHAAETALAAAGDRQRPLLEHARSLWGGEPLQEERYSDWATAFRERLVDRYVAVLTALVELDERSGDHVAAAETARDLVDLDPLNEAAHRALMRAYARAGRTGQALRQYLECRRALVETIGIEPSEATSRVQARILAGEAV